MIKILCLVGGVILFAGIILVFFSCVAGGKADEQIERLLKMEDERRKHDT